MRCELVEVACAAVPNSFVILNIGIADFCAVWVASFLCLLAIELRVNRSEAFMLLDLRKQIVCIVFVVMRLVTEL